MEVVTLPVFALGMAAQTVIMLLANARWQGRVEARLDAHAERLMKLER